MLEAHRAAPRWRQVQYYHRQVTLLLLSDAPPGNRATVARRNGPARTRWPRRTVWRESRPIREPLTSCWRGPPSYWGWQRRRDVLKDERRRPRAVADHGAPTREVAIAITRAWCRGRRCSSRCGWFVPSRAGKATRLPTASASQRVGVGDDPFLTAGSDRRVVRLGHQRWDIENQGFNELSTAGTPTTKHDPARSRTFC